MSKLVSGLALLASSCTTIFNEFGRHCGALLDCRDPRGQEQCFGRFSATIDRADFNVLPCQPHVNAEFEQLWCQATCSRTRVCLRHAPNLHQGTRHELTMLPSEADFSGECCLRGASAAPGLRMPSWQVFYRTMDWTHFQATAAQLFLSKYSGSMPGWFLMPSWPKTAATQEADGIGYDNR